jgi:hypothetical protein
VDGLASHPLVSARGAYRSTLCSLPGGTTKTPTGYRSRLCLPPTTPSSGRSSGRRRASKRARSAAGGSKLERTFEEQVWATRSTLNELEDNDVSAVTRLVTFVDLAEGVGDIRQMAFSARHEAVLSDGRRMLLLDDRGWSWSSLITFPAGDPSDRDSTREQHPDIWATTSVEDIEQTARMVVGPDEPFDGSSQEDAEQDHWAYLSDVLRQHGVVVDALDLRRLSHDVVLSERLLARVGRSATDV